MQKMIGLAVTGMLFMAPAADANSKVGAAAAEVGRYQLFQGSYTSLDLKRKETNTHQAVFIIDTMTGEVKRYINRIDDDGRYVETWLPTNLPLPDKKK